MGKFHLNDRRVAKSDDPNNHRQDDGDDPLWSKLEGISVSVAQVETSAIQPQP